MHARPSSRHRAPSRGPALLAVAAAALFPLIQAPLACRALSPIWTNNDFNSSWADPSNWSTFTIPNNGDFVTLTAPDVISQTINYDYAPGANITLASLIVNRNDSLLNPLVPTLSVAANTLNSNFISVGDSSAGGTKGRGIINQTGGTINLTGATHLSIGRLATDIGTYTLNGPSAALNIVQGAGMEVGSSGTGTFNHLAGSVTLANFTAVFVGTNTGSHGTYNLAAGYLYADLYVGYDGTGTFNHTGGTLTPGTTRPLYLGYDATGTGTYNLSGNGVMQTSDVYVGYNGAGTFVQSGGTHSNFSTLTVGFQGPGSYTLSDGRLFSGSVTIGVNGAASFLQSGGLHTVNVGLKIGSTSNTFASSYNLTGGNFNVGGTITMVGNAAGGAGVASLVQSGGGLVGNTIFINGNANFTLDAGYAQFIATNVNVGSTVPTAGLLTQTGGVFVSNTFNIATNSSTGHSRAFFNGGTATLGSLSIGRNSSDGLLHIGGSAAVSIGSINSFASIEVAGGTVNVNNGFTSSGTVSFSAGSIRISNGLTNTGAINLTGGTTSVAGPLSIDTNPGVIDLNGGKLIVQATNSTNKAALITTLNQAIATGKSIGNWSGKGITSTAAALDSGRLTVGVFDNAALHRATYGSQSADDNSLFVSPALKGDANLDGIVNFNDMLVVTGNWNLSGLSNGISTIDMAHGDLNGDGVVNFNDMLVVTGNWNNSSSQFNLTALLADPPT